MASRIWEVPYGQGILAYDFEVDWAAIERTQKDALQWEQNKGGAS